MHVQKSQFSLAFFSFRIQTFPLNCWTDFLSFFVFPDVSGQKKSALRIALVLTKKDIFFDSGKTIQSTLIIREFQSGFNSVTPIPILCLFNSSFLY